MIRREDMIEDGDKEPPGDVPDGEGAEIAPAAVADAPVDAASVPAPQPPISNTAELDVSDPPPPADPANEAPAETPETSASPPDVTPAPEAPEQAAAAKESAATEPPPAVEPPSEPPAAAEASNAAPAAETIALVETPAEPAESPAAPGPSAPPAEEITTLAPASPPPLVLPRRLPDVLEYAGWRLLETVGTFALAALLIFLLLPTSTSPDWSGLGERLAVTLPLLGLALLAAGALGVALGMLAIRLGGRIGGAIAFLAELGTGLSSLVLGLLLVLIVSGLLAWLPPGGFVPWEQDVGAALLSLVLPAAALAVPLALSFAAALWRAARPVLFGPALAAAADRGLDRRTAIRQIVLPSAWAAVWPALIVPLTLLPVVALILETAFYLPGLSRLLFAAIADRDIAGLQMALLAVAALVALCRLIGELLRGACDPLLTDR